MRPSSKCGTVSLSAVASVSRRFSSVCWSLSLGGMNGGWTSNLWDEGPQTQRSMPGQTGSKLCLKVPLTLAPLGGPKPSPPPCGFSQIAPEVLGVSL